MKSQKFMLGMEFNSKIFLFLIVAVPILVTAVTVLYPFSHISKKIKVIELGVDFEEKMKDEERRLNPTPGTEKAIFWTSSKKNKTSTSFVYLHGWSASRKELSPTIEKVAEEMRANLFMTRLTGHGLGPDGLGTTSTNKLLHDAEEAFLVGQKIGEKIILVGASTGASLALYLAEKYRQEDQNKIAALILVSPNFSPARADSILLRGPFGPWFSRLIIGTHYEFSPKNEEQKKYWTTRYPTPALTEMMNLVDGVRRIDLSAIKIPTLFLYTENDETIDVDLAKKKFHELGSEKKKIIPIASSTHILAGSIMSPETTDQVIEEIKKFLN